MRGPTHAVIDHYLSSGFSQSGERLYEADEIPPEAAPFTPIALRVKSPKGVIVDTVRSLTNPTPEGDWTSVCVASDGSYGVDEGLIASFPVRTSESGREIVQDVPLNEFGQSKLDATIDELRTERELVKAML